MGQATTIVLYHRLFLGCLIICIAVAALAVVLFFVLHIRGVMGYLTGRAARQRIQEMETESASNGRFESRARKAKSGREGQEEEKLEEAGGSGSAVLGARKVEHAVESAASSELTEMLVNPEGPERTSILVDDSAETLPLRDKTAQVDSHPKESDKRERIFEIEREIVLVHTEEMIE